MLRAIGYQGAPISGLPYDAHRHRAEEQGRGGGGGRGGRGAPPRAAGRAPRPAPPPRHQFARRCGPVGDAVRARIGSIPHRPSAQSLGRTRRTPWSVR
ncbi:hypothetical protein, partial [Nocardia asiatica]|uniref:hypothetical protein n=1 Tax=Nocardia asiatica TaxID=209252 RepID=UPI002456AB50